MDEGEPGEGTTAALDDDGDDGAADVGISGAAEGEGARERTGSCDGP